MSELNYTKGEWVIQVDRSDGAIQIEAPTRFVAEVYLYKTSTKWGNAAMFQPENIEPLANAHLISAAPDMYEALKAMLEDYRVKMHYDDPNENHIEALAIKALSKADGK